MLFCDNQKTPHRMSLTAGSRLGPYEIVSPIGAGGMGEVFLARDTRLERSVAIKILNREFADQPQLKQRFEREAKAISQLNHPHICTLHDVGHDNGTSFLVMEFLEGESLADRIARGALPLSDVVRYGAQIADALDRAHRAGIVHRDLKPGNVMMTKSGAKLLDFGLAKPSLLNASPALATELKPLTQEGTIVGTFQYMAPEQLEGQEADARTDIFALGALLYEMATGNRAFQGKTRTSLIAAIVGSEPPALSQVQPLTPPALEHVIRKCLAKDPDERWQSAHDVASELRWISEAGSQAGVAAPLSTRRAKRERLAWGLNLVTAILAVALTWAFLQWRRIPPPVVESTILPPDKFQLDSGSGNPAISPDGSRIAFVAGDGKSDPALFVRRLDSGVARLLPGTSGARYPFWSPDSRQIGFFAEAKLKTIDESGGAALALCDAAQPRGGTWSGGTIVFAPALGGLFAVPATGGTPTAVTSTGRGEALHLFPSFLPDGRHFLYLAVGGARPAVYIGSIDGKERQRVLDSDAAASYAPPGYVMFMRGDSLVAQRIDPTSLKLTGTPLVVAQSVSVRGRRPVFSVSATGVLAFQEGNAFSATQLVWVDRQGKTLGELAPPALFYSPRLSHDGRRLAVDISAASTGFGDIWLYDLVRNVASRLTYDPANESGPVWSADDRDIIFFSGRNGSGGNLYRISSGGTGEEELLVDSPLTKLPTDVSRDGQWLLFINTATASLDLWLYSFHDKKSRPWLATPFAEAGSQFSPDGKWIVYQSNESGRSEIYVRSFPESREKWLVSNGGGSMPAWRGDGRELFYLSLDHKMMSVPIKLSPEFSSGTPVPLFEARILGHPALRQYDVASDGSRFVLNRLPTEEVSAPMTLVQNWTARLKKP